MLYIDLLELMPKNPAKGKGKGKQRSSVRSPVESPVPRWATYRDQVVIDSVLDQAAHPAAFAH